MKWPFRWNADNVEHIAEHGVSPDEAEYVVRRARAPYPRPIGDEKFLAMGQTSDGAYLQVIYIFSPPAAAYVIHARPLTEREKKQYRRHRR